MKIKRVVIIFIIAFCLLSFVERSCLAQESVKSETWPVKYKIWKDNFNYAEFWNSLSVNEKLIYLLGVCGGLEKYHSETNKFILVTYKRLDNNQLSKEEMTNEFLKVSSVKGEMVAWALQVKFGLYNEIKKMTDDIYKDSANKYISVVDAGLLSFYKFHGEPIELLLKVTRERGETTESLLKELRERFWE
jgi:hypothetical protein